MRKTGLQAIHDLAKKNENIVFIGSDLGPGTLEEFKQTLPYQFYMEGISEAHILGMAAGMAMENNIVYVNTIASFLTRRSLEQLALDICAENLNVRIYGNGGGLVYGPLGHSHTAVDDFALLSALPNLTILAPADAHEMNTYIRESETYEGPIYIRLGKGGDPLVTSDRKIKIGKALDYKSSIETDKLIITTGVMLQRALEVKRSIPCDILHYGTIRPFDEESLLKDIEKYKHIIVLEEHLEEGGLGTKVIKTLFKNKVSPDIFQHFNLGAKYIEVYGRQEEIFEYLDLSPEKLVMQINNATP